MNTTTYPSPVDKLLTIGEPDPAQSQDWPNYLELGLGPEHIPDLLRMLADNELFDPELLKEGAEKPEGWAPHHAMRALGQLRDVAAVEPLLSQSDRLLDYNEGLGEWGIEELPEVFGLIGPAAIPAHPEAREESVTALTRQLESAQENDPRLNSFIIDNLINLKAVEAAPVIERAFATDSVDMDIVGDWDDVQSAFGLKPPKERPPTPTLDTFFQSSTPESVTTPSSSPSTALHTTTTHKRVTAQKTKHKMAKQSRKKNRRRK